MNTLRLLLFVTAAITLLLIAVITLSSVLPAYEFPNYGYSVFLLSGAFAAFYFARRRLACR